MERTIPSEFHTEREAIAWAAGLFDGEGCITWSLKGRNGRSSIVQVGLGMSDQDSVDKFAATVGFGKVYYHHPPAHRAKGYKPIYNWHAYGFEHSQALVAMFWPFLCERRRARATECLEAARYTQHKRDRYRCPKGHAYAGDNLQLEPIASGKFARRCRICRREQQRLASARYKAAKKAADPS